jgi:hypothetical protein
MDLQKERRRVMTEETRKKLRETEDRMRELRAALWRSLSPAQRRAQTRRRLVKEMKEGSFRVARSIGRGSARVALRAITLFWMPTRILQWRPKKKEP